MNHSRGVESELRPAAPKKPLPARCCRGCSVAAVATLLILAGWFYFVWMPMTRVEVEAGAEGPKITFAEQTTEASSDAEPVAGNGQGDRTRPGTNAEEPVRARSQADIRNAVTDYLILPRENTANEHPLDPALEVARRGLAKIRSEIQDYTALVVKQEMVNGRLRKPEYMRVKIRRQHELNGQKIPRSIYTRFVKPKSLAGQEAIWVANQRDGHLIGHAGGFLNIVRATLKPDGAIAMRGNRYPITELGIETLIVRMLEKGHRDRDHGECNFEFDRSIQIDGQKCTLITITHPEKKHPFEFHVAEIYINDELDLPIGYQGYLWPEKPGGEPQLVESYFYREMKINVGLQDIDFDPNNPEYDYP